MAVAAAVLVTLVSSSFSAPTATAAAPRVDGRILRRAVTPDGIFEHLQAFQEIADANDGTRAAGTSGYDASADYVAGRLLDVGYEVRAQSFEYDHHEELAPPVLDPTEPDLPEYSSPSDLVTMHFSGSGDVTAGGNRLDQRL
jgi:hypothetical protein